MDKKLRLFLSALAWLTVPFAYSQTSSPPFSLPTSITVDVVDHAGLTLNTSTGTFPIIDLINNVYGNSPGVSLIYPILSNDHPVSALDAGLNIAGNITDVILQMPFETYVKGVVRVEMFPTWDRIEVFKAEAVAARSYAAGLAIPYKAEDVIVSSGVTYSYDTIGSDADQAYVPYVLSLVGWDGDDQGNDGIAGQGTTLTTGQAIYCFDRTNGQTLNGLTTGIDQIIFGAFSSSFGGRSKDELFFHVNNHWGFPPYLKSRDSGDAGQGVIISSGLGLSQYGANNLAQPTPGWDYQGILNYYYAVNPPIVRAVDVFQYRNTTNLSTLRHSTKWNDTPTPGATSISINNMAISGQPSNRALTVLRNDPLIAGTRAEIFITTNESIDTRVQPLVVIGSGTQAVTATGSWNPFSTGNFPKWDGTFVVPPATLPCTISINGQGVSIYISPAPSTQPIPAVASSVTLDSDPTTPASLALAPGPSAWNGYEAGTDTNHAISVVFPAAFVQAVTISQQSTPIYQSAWPLAPPPTPNVVIQGSDPVTYLADSPTVTTDMPAASRVDTHFDVHFNIPMNPTVVPTIVANFYVSATTTPAVTQVVPQGSWSSDNKTYSADVPANFITAAEGGDSVTLAISGAQDAQNNPMDGDGRTIGYESATPGTWIGVEAEPDTANAFVVSTATPCQYCQSINFGPQGTPVTMRGEFVAADQDENIYTADFNGTIRKSDKNGTPQWSVAGISPQGLIVDSTGFMLIVADSQQNTFVPVVNEYSTSNGQLLHTISNSILGSAADVGSDQDGLVYVADSDNSQVAVFDTSRNLARHWGSYENNPQGSATNGTFFNPEWMAVDGSGNVYVGDNIVPDSASGWSRVQKFNSTGSFIWSIESTPDNAAGHFTGIAGLHVDCFGNLYLWDTNDSKVLIYDASGSFLAEISDSNTSRADFFTVTPIGNFLFTTGTRILKDGCGFGSSSPTPTRTSTPTDTPTFTSTPTFTPIDTFTPTPTASITPIATAQATVGASGITVTLPNGTSIEIGAGILSQGTTVTISEYPPSSAPPLGSFQDLIGNIYTFTAVASDGTPINFFGGNTVNLVFPFDPNQIPSGYNANQLQVSYFDGSSWNNVSSTLDGVHDTLTVNTNHLSVWGVFIFLSTPTPSPTNTPTLTITDTATETPTWTATNSATLTPTDTATDSTTSTPTSTATLTATETPTDSPSPTPTSAATPTTTNSPTFTPTPTATNTFTETDTPTATLTPTNTTTKTSTNTATQTPTDTSTPSSTRTPTNTSTRTPTNSPTNTQAVISTNTATRTPSSTATRTPTKTPTRTPTRTFTSTPTLVVCTGTLTSPKLNLQVGCFQKDPQQERIHVKIINWNSSPVTIGNLSIKMWMNESQLCNMQQWVQLGTVCQSNGTGCVNVNNTGFTATVASLTGTCTVDASHKANQVITFAANGNTQVIPANGGYWDGGFDLAIGRSNPQMDDNWNDDYSKTASCPANLMEDSHFALYYGGTLLKEWTNATTQDTQTGGAPCCGGGGSSMMPLLFNESEGAPSPTFTMTPTPNSVAPEALVKSIAVGPNISNGEHPIRFFLSLTKPAQVSLALFSLMGEQVYSVREQGALGLNTLVWEAENTAGLSVASGIYLYYLRVEDGITTETKIGKIVIIH